MRTSFSTIFASSTTFPSQTYFRPLLKECEMERGTEIVKQNLGECERVRECKGVTKRTMKT